MERLFSKLSPHDAKKAVEEGASVLCLNVPQGTLFSIDLSTFEVGPRFKGVKMIPNGAHFICTVAKAQAQSSVKRVSFAEKVEYLGEAKSAEAMDTDSSVEDSTSVPPPPSSEPMAETSAVATESRQPKDAEMTDLAMGFWLYLRSGQVSAFEWSARHSCLVPVGDAAQCERLHAAVGKHEFDRWLGPYPLRTYVSWQALTTLVTDKVIKQMAKAKSPTKWCAKTKKAETHSLESDMDTVKADVEMGGALDESKSVLVTERMSDESLLTPPTSVPRTESSAEMAEVQLADESTTYDLSKTVESLRLEADYAQSRAELALFQDYSYVPIPSTEEMKRKFAMTAAEISEFCMDKSSVVTDALRVRTHSQLFGLLAQLQHAFVVFLVGANVHGLDFWKQLVDLLCHCFTLYCTEMDFYNAFVRVLLAQMRQLPDDFFADHLTRHNFLNRSLLNLFEMSAESEVMAAMSHSMRADLFALHKLCKDKFGKVFPFAMAEFCRQ